jgi:RNA polymerase sigma-70 factor (ECF subfamily)
MDAAKAEDVVEKRGGTWTQTDKRKQFQECSVPSDLQKCSDEELARQTQAGSLVAFEELVYRYEARVYGFVANCCRNRADAREVTQETFVRAFQAIGQFDCRRSFGPWLFTIARRKCIDHHRAAPYPTDEAMPDLPDDNDPAELLARQEERQNLWELARRRLPDTQFQALWLRYAEDMSVAGIAQVLRKTQTYVKVLLFRARQALARELRAGQVSASPTRLVSSKPAPDPETAISPTHVGRGGVRAGCVVEFPGAVASPGPGCAKKGLL